MHVVKVEIENVKCIEHLVWEIEPERAAGWHVLLGDNGSGKTTVLRALIATQLRLPEVYLPYLDGSGGWIRAGETSALSRITWTGTVHGAAPSTGKQELRWSNGDDTRLESSGDNPPVGDDFVVSYGPFRRFWGGQATGNLPGFKEPRHTTLYSKGEVLSDVLGWLRDLRLGELEQRDDRRATLAGLTALTNDGLMPHGAQLDKISSDGVFFKSPDNGVFRLQGLPDGHLSVLCLVWHLIHMLDECVGPAGVFDAERPGKVLIPGVVVVDEIDAHLHPTWQCLIGNWLCDHFPNMQFLVTTHSPLICQSVTEDRGSIWLLPNTTNLEPGDNAIRRAEGSTFRRLIYGNLLDVYGTGYFGKIGRSEKANEKLDRLAELNVKELRRGLSASEKAQQRKLRAELPTDAFSLT